jgi:hypothetical protein
LKSTYSLNNKVGDEQNLVMKAPADKKEDHFQGKFDDIKFTRLKDAMEKQKTPEAQLKLKGKPDQIIDDPFDGKKKYIIAFADQKKGQDEKRVFLYMEDENEINRFKNLILTNSDIGQRMLKRSDTVRVREELINVWKVRQAEEFYRLMDEWINPSIQKPKKIVSKKKNPDQRLLLRRVGIKKALRDERLRLDDELGKGKNRKQKAIERIVQFCEQKRKKNLKWSYDKIGHMKRHKKPLELVFTPRKLYFLGAEEQTEGKIENSSIDDVFIGIWPKRILNTEIPATGLDNSRMLQLSRIPKTTRIFATEYATISTPWEIDCNKNKGQYLYAYTRNGATKKISSAGCVEISDRLPLVFTIDMVDENSRTNSNRPVINSKLAIRRERIEVPLPNDEMFRNLFQAGNFGFMNRYNNARKKDAGVGDVSMIEGYGEKYSKTFQILGGDFSTSEAIAYQESEVYRWIEWRYFEDIVAEANKQASNGFDYQNYSKESEVVPVHDKNSFLFQLGRYTKEEPENVDFNEKSFLFFDRHKWVNNKCYRDANLRYEKAMITGMPTYLYLPVWKSLGKTPLLKYLVEKVVRVCTKGSGKATSWINVYSTLQVAGVHELNRNPELKTELEKLAPQTEYPADYVESLKGMLQAYLQLSLFLEDASLLEEQEMLIQGFSLKNVAAILPIMKNLLDLYYITAKNTDKDPRCASVTEDDPFYVLLSFAFVFLPDHFLMPLLTFSLSDDLITNYDSMRSFGLKFAHQIKNKMFINVGSNGSFKLSVILAMCIKKDSPEVYKKMTDLGFPFLTFCLEMSETLFTKTLNADTLYKLWNLIFFEGGNTIKRRAQQIVLSAILSRVHFCKKLILESRSANEIYWHLKADGFLNHDSSEFIAEIFTIRRNHFVTKETGIMDAMKSVFVTDESVEKSYKKIKKEILTEFEHIAVSNYTYLNWVNSAIESQSSKKGAYSIETLKNFLQEWKVDVDDKTKKVSFSVYDPLSVNGVVVLTKPSPNSITFGICYSDFGNLVPEETTIEFSGSYTATKKLIKFTDVRF